MVRSVMLGQGGYETQNEYQQLVPYLEAYIYT